MVQTLGLEAGWPGLLPLTVGRVACVFATLCFSLLSCKMKLMTAHNSWTFGEDKMSQCMDSNRGVCGIWYVLAES